MSKVSHTINLKLTGSILSVEYDNFMSQVAAIASRFDVQLEETDA